MGRRVTPGKEMDHVEYRDGPAGLAPLFRAPLYAYTRTHTHTCVLILLLSRAGVESKNWGSDRSNRINLGCKRAAGLDPRFGRRIINDGDTTAFVLGIPREGCGSNKRLVVQENYLHFNI